jgi:transcriptional regulator with XRE-family HTH domain
MTRPGDDPGELKSETMSTPVTLPTDVRAPSPVDVHVGARVRMRRKMLNISQEQLANALGLTFQQVQKYERGANRISASKLYDIARTLQAPVSSFFDGLADPLAGGVDAASQTASQTVSAFLLLPEAMQLAEQFPKIGQASLRRRIVDLARALADEEPPANG